MTTEISGGGPPIFTQFTYELEYVFITLRTDLTFVAMSAVRLMEGIIVFWGVFFGRCHVAKSCSIPPSIDTQLWWSLLTYHLL